MVFKDNNDKGPRASGPKPFLFFFTGLILCLSLAACTHKKEDLSHIPVMTVNGEALLVGPFSESLATRLKTFDALAAKDPINIHRTKEAVLREFIVSRLLLQYGRDHHLTVSDDEVNNEFDRLRKTYPDDFTFKAALADSGQTVEQWKDSLKVSLMEKKVFADLDDQAKKNQKGDAAQQSDETAARNDYEDHKTEFDRPAQVHLLQILVAKEEDAEHIAKDLKNGKSSFKEFAQKYSISPEGKDGGDMGYVPKGTAPVFDTAFSMHPGQVSGVLKSSYGYHIIKLLDKKPAGRLSFDDVKARLLRQVEGQRQQKAFDQWLEAAIKTAKIERNDALLEKIKVRTEGEE